MHTHAHTHKHKHIQRSAGPIKDRYAREIALEELSSTTPMHTHTHTHTHSHTHAHTYTEDCRADYRSICAWDCFRGIFQYHTYAHTHTYTHTHTHTHIQRTAELIKDRYARGTVSEVLPSAMHFDSAKAMVAHEALVNRCVCVCVCACAYTSQRGSEQLCERGRKRASVQERDCLFLVLFCIILSVLRVW